MGYWTQDGLGHSFEGDNRDPEPLIWGDAPADVMGDALDRIAAVFVKDIGRLPSMAEILGGVRFTLHALRLPDGPEDCPEVSEDDQAAIETDFWAAEAGDRDAQRRLTEVVARLRNAAQFTGSEEPK